MPKEKSNIRTVRIATTFAIILASTSVHAQPPNAAPQADGRPAQTPVLRKLTITLAGVALHEWEVTTGAGPIELPIRLADIDDVLKSITASSGSNLISVGLPGNTEANTALEALPFDPSSFKSPLLLLNALRGNRVSLPNLPSGIEAPAGLLISAELQNQEIPGTTITIPKTRVTLKTDTGIGQFVLEDLQAIRFDEPGLNERMQTALAALRQQTNSEIRVAALTIGASQGGLARFTTVTAAPLWKPTYRLTMPATDGAKARLQAWAVFENTEAVDWNRVDVTLQSGNPVSFRQALYKQANVQRPEAPIDQLEHMLPPTDSRPIEAFPVAKAFNAARAMAPAAPGSAMNGAGISSMQAAELGRLTTAMDATADYQPTQQPADPPAQGLGVSFHVAMPVTLKAGRSTTLPFIDAAIAASRVDMLSVNRERPMAAVRITNDTPASWPAGAVSTQDVTGFKGDARLPAIPPGESRMLTFATDLTIAAHWSSSNSQQLTGYTVAKGMVTITFKERATSTVDIVGSAGSPGQTTASGPKTIIIEVPRTEGTSARIRGADIDTPTTVAWRARTTLDLGKTAHVQFDIDRPIRQLVQLAQASDVLAGIDTQALDGLSPEAITALRHIFDLQDRARTIEDAIKAQIQEKGDAIADQTRARSNAQMLTQTDPQRAHYVSNMAEADNRIAQISALIDQSRRDARAAATQLADAVAKLDIQ